MATCPYQLHAATSAISLTDTSSSLIHHHHIVADSLRYEGAAGLNDIPGSSSCFPYYNYSPYSVPYYDPVIAKESTGSVDDSVISNPDPAREEIGCPRSASPGSMDVARKRRQGKQGGDETSNKTKKQRKCGVGGRRRNTNKCSSAAGIAINAAEASQEPPPPYGYIHVRARRGQATDSHSLAERVRREKISTRMKLLRGLVPGCDKVTSKALMLDEIINYVQSLQHQVEFLSMKLESLSPVLYDFGSNVDLYMPQMQKVERLSRSPPVQSAAQAGDHIAVQTPTTATADAAASFAEATHGYNPHPFTEALREGSSVVPYLLHGCHPGLSAPASYDHQDRGSSSLVQVFAGNTTNQFLQRLQFNGNNVNNLCSFQ